MQPGGFPTPVQNQFGEAFEVTAEGAAPTKVNDPKWIPTDQTSTTFGFKNTIIALPLLFDDPVGENLVSWGRSLFLPGQGLLVPTAEAKVFAWFADAFPADDDLLSTTNFSRAWELKFRAGKMTLEDYKETNTDSGR